MSLIDDCYKEITTNPGITQNQLFLSLHRARGLKKSDEDVFKSKVLCSVGKLEKTGKISCYQVPAHKIKSDRVVRHLRPKGD